MTSDESSVAVMGSKARLTMQRSDARARRALRHRLTALVYRDAARSYGLGLALVVMPLVYLFREWPPWAIRDALHGLPAAERAGWMAAAHAIYGLATLPVVRLLLGSERLRWWWALPLPAGWWRRVHLQHLALLDAPWLLAIAYGVAPLSRGGLGEAIAAGVGFMAITLAGQIALVSTTDRGAAVTVAWIAAWASLVAAAVSLPSVAGAGLGLGALAVALRRLGRPMPERSARRRGAAGGPPVVALARLGALAVRRREPVALGWGLAVELVAVGLAALALSKSSAIEPDSLAALLRGLTLVCAMVGSAVSLRATRLLDGDRPWLDSWGIDPRHERSARLLLAAVGVLPAALVGTPLLAGLDPLGRAWLPELLVATAWASLGVVTTSFALEARRALHRPRLLRALLRMGAALILVGIAGTGLILLPWALLDAMRLPSAQRRADRARQRFETSQRDDHEH